MGKEYNEVIEILKYIPKEDYIKIPEEMLVMFEKNMESDYVFKYNPKLTLNEQNVSKKAKTIIAILFKKYWATDEQKIKITAKEKYDLNKIEEAKREKYNSESIFKGK